MNLVLTLIKKTVDALNDIITFVVVLLETTLCLFRGRSLVRDAEQSGLLLLLAAHHLGGVAAGGGSAEVQRGVHAIRKLGCLRGTKWRIVRLRLLEQRLIPLCVFELGRIGCREGTLLLLSYVTLLEDRKMVVVVKVTCCRVAVHGLCVLMVELILNLLSISGIGRHHLCAHGRRGKAGPHLKRRHLPKRLSQLIVI